MTQFKPGQSGNPNGRPKGIKDRRTVFRELVEPHSDELVQKAIQMALDGDQQMLRLLLDRVLPAKPKDDLISNSFLVEGTMSDQARNIIKMLSDGQLALSEGIGLLKTMNQQIDLIEYDEIDRRLTVLEKNYKII